jgi:hypothetical protein
MLQKVVTTVKTKLKVKVRETSKARSLVVARCIVEIMWE